MPNHRPRYSYFKLVAVPSQLNWATLDPNFAKKWIQCHVDVCRALRKPCLLEEVRVP